MKASDFKSPYRNRLESSSSLPRGLFLEALPMKASDFTAMWNLPTWRLVNATGSRNVWFVGNTDISTRSTKVPCCR